MWFPLATLLSRKFNVLGFDISQKRIDELSNGEDITREVTAEDLQAETLILSANPAKLSNCSVLIVTVPTPIDEHRTPDLRAIRAATQTVGEVMRPGTTIVYESTVYPGATEEVCVPILEETSGLKWKRDFFLGYSPERVNPGDKNHTIDKIVKVVAGDTPESTKLLAFTALS